MKAKLSMLQWGLLSLPLLVGGCASAPEERDAAQSVASAAPAAPAYIVESAVNEPTFRKQAPMIYTVQKGDTLWGLAQKFLNNPADWRKIWHANPQVRNPNLIFPGDQLEIVTINGQQRLTKRLTPQVRISPLDKAIPTLSFELLKGFLSYPQIIEVPALNDAPRIISSVDDRLVMGVGDKVYASGAFKPDELLAVVRPSETLFDPASGEVLGYEAEGLGLARVIKNDSPATLQLVKANKEVRPNDRLVPLPPVLTHDLELLPPRAGLSAEVISLAEKTGSAVQWQIVAISAGKREGVIPGQVLRIFTPSKDASLDTTPIVDWRAIQATSPFPPNEGKPSLTAVPRSESFPLPGKDIGDAVVFLSYERVSYVLITQSTQQVRLGDCMAADKHSCWPNRKETD
ncbi:MAG: LysM peptidoglycan-binding domain-containing protein [Pseudomonadota bacterium]